MSCDNCQCKQKIGLANLTSEIMVEMVAHHGSDLRCAQKAWVSTDKGGDRTEEDAERLVKFLYKHGHCQCFMGSGVAFRVYAPYRSLVQIIRHMTANPSEPVDLTDIHVNVVQSSARYGAVPDELYQAVNLMNLASTEGVDTQEVAKLVSLSSQALKAWKELNNKLQGKQSNLRDELNNYLPQGAMGYLDIDFNLWSFRNFVLKRTDKHAQATLREIASKMVEEVNKLEEFKVFNGCLRGEMV